jgi:protein farnesyltransferase/geranylgeranyltransferase type-1 subunit alpha
MATFIPSSDDTPYSERSEWKDVTPILQQDGPTPVCAIKYSARFVDVMNYFRAILAADEHSERAWKLTEDAIDVNPSNYTAWTFRRVLIRALNKDINEEIDYLNQFADPNPKNYQLWHHRRVIAEEGKDANAPLRELEYTRKVLTGDEGDRKNYHAWSHRQWVVKTFNLWDDEINFVKEMLDLDIRNNSAWNHRWFIITNTETGTTTSSGGVSTEIRVREILFALSLAKKAVNNSSSWSYIRGFLEGQTIDSNYDEVTKQCQDLLETNPSAGCAATLMKINLLINTEATRLIAMELCSRLASELDPTRSNYWKEKLQNLKMKEE